jgi:hypothetical protein
VTPPVPRRAERLAIWSLPPRDRATILGDLQEGFLETAAEQGERAATNWYWRQTLTSVGPNLIRRLRGDKRRLGMFKSGLSTIAVSVLFLALNSIKSHAGFTSQFICLTWIGSGFLSIGQSMFQRRIEMSRLQKNVLFSFVALLLAWVVAMIVVEAEPQLVLLLLASALMWTIRLWPWWPLEVRPAESVVRGRPKSGDLVDQWLAISIVNVPGEMSELVLCQGGAPELATDPRPVRHDEPTIKREFRQFEAVRVCAVVCTGDAPSKAVVDLVEPSTKRVVWTRRANVAYGALEEIVYWEDRDGRGPRDNFAQIDETVPLNGVPPGTYQLRITNSDGAHASVKEE